MSTTTDAFSPAAVVEPFWQRIHKFFTLPLDRAVLMRIAGLAVAGDVRFYPDFDEQLKVAMRRETQLFFENLVREDRSVLEMFTATIRS